MIGTVISNSLSHSNNEPTYQKIQLSKPIVENQRASKRIEQM